VTAPRVPSLAGASRYAFADVPVPDPLEAPGAYRDAIRRLIDEEKTHVLVPISEASLLSLLPLQGTVDGLTLPFTTIDRFLRICDKREVLAAAPEVGIATPHQTVLESAGDLHRPGGGVALPVVVKPARSIVGDADQLHKTRVRHARTMDELREIVCSTPTRGFPLLLQRPVRGPGVGVFLLVWEGDVLAAFCHRRIREKPPSGGVSVFRESIPLGAGLLHRSRRLLERFDWQGVAMVEYKIDAETGIPHLMEVNGRFWGSLQLAVDSGVDFPSLLVAAACGESLRPELGYRTGVRSRWWWGEVDHLVGVLRNGGDGARGQAGNGARASSWGAGRSALRGWLTPGRNEILRWRDPRPFIQETARWLEHVRGR